jgi:putative spermidine/putrescine transport system permease protein
MTLAPAAPAKTSARGEIAAWLGVTPFLIFAALFLIAPTVSLMVGAFQDREGAPTLGNVVRLFQPSILHSYALSLEVSAASAIVGALLGFALATAATRGGLPGYVRAAVMTFCGVASNFAGIPLAFAFVATLGRMGLVTVLLKAYFGLNIYAAGFNLFTFTGLTLTYLYFQIPLMVLVITPALDGMKREWREAAEVLGASRWQYLRMIAWPILGPSFFGATLLLFANAFGAIATAYSLTGPSLNIVPILLFAEIRGDVLHDANLGFAIALGMLAITGVSNFVYLALRARAEAWLK